MMRPVEIVGGGLAGLGLGLGLRAQGVPVTIYESGTYPRHRVCGEFITGLDLGTCQSLQIECFMQKAQPAHSVTWFESNGKTVRHTLPEPARRLSRFSLDQDMAGRFSAQGGNLVTHTRAEISARAGRVICSGRLPDVRSPWIGLKQHFLELELQDDLEIHFGRNAYVGLTRVENDCVNVCGLFPRHQRNKKHANTLVDHIEAAGLRVLAERLLEATAIEESSCAVAGLDYGNKKPPSSEPNLGDCHGLIPPFTGHGMTIALQSAALATDTISRWSQGEIEWDEAATTLQRQIRRHLHKRIFAARLAHPWLLAPGKRQLVFFLSRCGLLPFSPLYKLLH